MRGFAGSATLVYENGVIEREGGRERVESTVLKTVRDGKGNSTFGQLDHEDQTGGEWPATESSTPPVDPASRRSSA